MFNIQKRARLQQSQQEEFVRNSYGMIDDFDANIPIDQNIDNEEDETVGNDDLNEEVESFFHSSDRQPAHADPFYNR